MIGDLKEVDYHKYCKMCKHETDSEDDVNSPCFECLEQFTNQDSHKPVNYIQKDKEELEKKKKHCKCRE